MIQHVAISMFTQEEKEHTVADSLMGTTDGRRLKKRIPNL